MTTLNISGTEPFETSPARPANWWRAAPAFLALLIFVCNLLGFVAAHSLMRVLGFNFLLLSSGQQHAVLDFRSKLLLFGTLFVCAAILYGGRGDPASATLTAVSVAVLNYTFVALARRTDKLHQQGN